MAQLLQLQTFYGDSGALSVFENIFEGKIKEICFLVHKNKLNPILQDFKNMKTQRGLVALNGSCTIHVKKDFFLDKPEDCLLLLQDDSFDIIDYSEDCLLMLIIKDHEN
jgi:fructose-1-phosphate kinase PfkB-like protein